MFWEMCDFQSWFDVGFIRVWCCRTDKFSLLKLCRMFLKVHFWMAQSCDHLALSGWHIYILKQIPIKGLGFTVKHFKSLLLFHSLLQTQILHQKWCRLAPEMTPCGGKEKTTTKKNLQMNKNPTAGSKGSGFVYLLLLWQRWSSEIDLCALLETYYMIFKEIASLFLFQVLNL